MKNLFAYGAMCATLVAAASCGGGEKNEVVAPAEEPAAWSDTNAFDTNNDATGSEVTNYNQNGQIVSVDRFSVDKQTKESKQTDHIIYQNGKPVYSNVFREDGTVEGHEVYTYDANGNILEQVIETYSDGLKRIAPSMRYVYTYDANGDVTSIKEQKSTPKGWSTNYEWTYTYDAQGRLSGRNDYTGDGKERKQGCQYGWSYEDGCDKIKQVDYFTFDLKQGKLKHDSKYRYTYNAAGQVTKKTVIRHKMNKTRDDVNSRLFTYEYNKNGQLTVIFEQKWNSASQSWYEVTSTTIEYDEAGQLAKKTSIKNTNKGTRFLHEIHTQGAPADKPNVAPAAPSYPTKPEINLEDKHLTSAEED